MSKPNNAVAKRKLMDAFNQTKLRDYKKATPERKYCPSSEESLVGNFAIHDLDSCVTVHHSTVQGCEQTGADVMLTFGSEIKVLNGNNIPVRREALRHVDVFLNRRQAEGLQKELTRVLSYDQSTSNPPPDML
jgi:hypothetical protein